MTTQNTESLDQIQARAVAALSSYPKAVDSDATRRLRETADAFVSAREHFYTRTGATDWLGQTGAYRAWVRETLAAAHLPREDVTTIQSAVRYHVGNVLRERLDADTLTALGLRTISPRERSAEKRQGTSALLSLFSGGQRITNTDEMLLALTAFSTGVRRFDLSSLGKRDAAKVRAEAEAVRALLAGL